MSQMIVMMALITQIQLIITVEHLMSRLQELRCAMGKIVIHKSSPSTLHIMNTGDQVQSSCLWWCYFCTLHYDYTLALERGLFHYLVTFRIITQLERGKLLLLRRQSFLKVEEDIHSKLVLEDLSFMSGCGKFTSVCMSG